jgi:hypothetical protein
MLYQENIIITIIFVIQPVSTEHNCASLLNVLLDLYLVVVVVEFAGQENVVFEGTVAEPVKYVPFIIL